MSNNDKRSLLRGFESAIFDLLYTGADEEQWGQWLSDPLQHAVAAGDLGLVIKLVNAGAFGNPLCAAIAGGQVALARDLVERGPVTETDENGDSPLRLAADAGDEEIMSLLLQKGACPNTEDRGCRSLLYSAAANGRLATVNLLLAAGADTSLRYFENDDSGVDDASGTGRWYCSDRDAGEDNSALDVAVANGHVEVVTALTRSGVDVNAVDSKHSTTLHKAACSTTNEADVIDVLVKAGDDVNAVSELWSRVPLHCASEAGTLGAILVLLKNRARINEKYCQGRTPLHLTGLKDNLPAMEALLAAGADVNAIDGTSKTALHLTALRGSLPAMKALLAAGAGVDAIDCAGTTALHSAAICQRRTGPSNIVADFLAAHCERSKKDAENAVDLLLRWDADETVVNAEGKTPLEGAVARFSAFTGVGLNDLGRLRDLLTKVPFGRNWRRRGWLLLYRAYWRRMVPIPGTGEAPSDRATRE